MLLNFPFSWLALHYGAAPYSVYIVAICIAVGCLLLRLWFLRSMVGLSLHRYLKCVVGNVLFTTVVAIALPIIFHFFIDSGFLRLIIVGFISVLSAGFAILFIGCTFSERNFILSKTAILKTKFTRVTA